MSCEELVPLSRIARSEQCRGLVGKKRSHANAYNCSGWRFNRTQRRSLDTALLKSQLFDRNTMGKLPALWGCCKEKHMKDELRGEVRVGKSYWWWTMQRLIDDTFKATLESSRNLYQVEPSTLILSRCQKKTTFVLATLFNVPWQRDAQTQPFLECNVMNAPLHHG